MSTMPENSTQATEQPQALLGLVPSAPEPVSGTPGAGGVQAPSSGEPGVAAAPPQAGEPWPDELRTRFPEIATKFKDPTALAEGYANLERVFHAFNQLGVSPEHALQMLQEQAEAEPPAGEEPAGETTGSAPAEVGEIPAEPSAFLDVFAENPKGTIERMAEQVALNVVTATFTAQQMWREAEARYPDLAKHEKAMSEVLRAAPGLVRFPDVIDRIYRMVAGGTPAPEAIARAKAEARQEAIAQVTGTTVESGRTGAVPPSGTPTGQQVVEDILTSGVSPNTIPGLRPV